MKRFFILLLLIPFLSKAQTTIKMSAFPEISSINSNYYLPVFATGNNYKMNANTFFNERLATKSTSSLAEGSNQYFTVSRARAALSGISGINYNASTGAVSADVAYFDNRYTTNLQLGPSMKYVSGYLDVVPLEVHETSKAVPDADYTMQPGDEVLIFPNPAATRTFTMLPASSRKGKTLTLICSADANGKWIFGGSVGYIQYGVVSGTPYTQNSTPLLYAQDRTRLVSFLDTDGTWKWLDTK